MSSSVAPSGNVCFNNNCKESMKGQGKVGGVAPASSLTAWTLVQIHCGCIVSFHTFVLLDAGAGSGPVPWRQAPSLFNGSAIQNELQHKAPFPDATGSIDRLCLYERPSASLPDNNRKDSEMLMTGKLKIGVPGILENGYAGTDIHLPHIQNFSTGNVLDLLISQMLYYSDNYRFRLLLMWSNHCLTGLNREELPKSCISGPRQLSYANNDLSAPIFCLPVGSACKNEPTDHSKSLMEIDSRAGNNILKSTPYKGPS
ncbi:hypothetical protein HAX54_012803 [Datura stramonium]|uniref:Uncharacterized protein n=1 Tax=Datura stramonium TaxID=4076 RepID=A0ABS8TLA7_DATST|nr:hypothetical protein [Datura stramonium]